MKRRTRQLCVLLVAVGSLGGLLFVLNGLVLADRHSPRMRDVGVEPSATASAPDEVTIVSYNIAKAFVHRGGLRFDSRESVESRLRTMASTIRTEKPDFVFISEAITACGPCEIDQVEFLARESGLRFTASGENYNVGLPFFRIAGGNAILSRTPLEPVANIDLAGRRPFYITSNNRRALVVAATIGRNRVVMAALHNDSFDMRNNEVQMRQVLDFLDDRTAIVAGDFNNRPNERSIRLIRESGRFSGAFEGPPTFFEGGRQERLDYIFVPNGWELRDHRVFADDTSDHRPLVCRFRIPSEP